MTALAAASAAAQPAGGSNTRWIAIGTDRDGELFYDAGTVRRSGAMINFRLRVVRPAAEGDATPLIAGLELDCRNQTMAVRSVERFGADGASQGVTPVPSPRHEQIYANRTEANFYRRLCPASLAQPLPTPPPMPMIQVVPPSPPPPPVAPPLPPPPPPGRSARAQWQTPPHALLTARDYPASALRADEEGRTQVRLAITRSGRVRSCTVTASSGFAALDSATCRILQERARFTPARDARGRRAEDTIPAAITWRIPD